MKRAIGTSLFLLLAMLVIVPDAWAVYCTNCGTWNEPGNKYCVNCGEPLLGDFMGTLIVRVKQAQIFHNGEVIGTAAKNTKFRYVGDAGDYYDAAFSSGGVSIQCQIKKSDVTRNFSPVSRDHIGPDPLSARETSELLDRFKNNEEKLRELQRKGHPNYQTAIMMYLEAIKWSRDRVTTDARERARRAYDRAEEIKQRQDRMLTLELPPAPPSGTFP